MNDAAAAFPDADDVDDGPVITSQNQYIECENWGHLFGPGSTETMTRWLYDRQASRLVAAYSVDGRNRWNLLDRINAEDLLESLRHNDALGDGDGYRSFGIEFYSRERLSPWALEALHEDEALLQSQEPARETPRGG